MARTSDEIVDAVKLACALPSNQALMTDARILSICNEELESKVTPTVQSINQDYFVAKENVSLVVGQDMYSIPARAIGRTLRDLKMQDSSSGSLSSMALLNLEDSGYTGTQSNPTSFYFMGDRIVISPTPSSATSYSLLMYYLERPGRLAALSSCSRIINSSSDGATFTTFTVDQVPAAFTVGAVCDMIQGVSGNATLDKDEPITNIAGSQITFGYVDPAVGIGDYLAPQYYSPVLQVPEEAFSYLVALTAERVLRAIGDTEGAESLAKNTPEKKKMFASMLSPRVSGENIKITHRNGLVRTGRGWYGPLFRG